MEPDRLAPNVAAGGRRGDDDEAGPGLPFFLTDPLGVLRRRWRWMAIVGLACLLLTGVATALWEPVYVGRATLLVSSQQIPEEFVRSTVQEDALANITALLDEVLSQVNLTRILDRYELYADDAGSSTLARVAKLQSNVSFEPSAKAARGQTSLVYVLSFEDSEPKVAADVANTLASAMVEASIARRNERARRTTEFLRSALARDEEELREVSRQVSDFRRAHLGELPSELESNLRRLEMLADQRHDLVAQLTEKETRADMASSGGTTTNQIMLADLRRQLAQQMAIHTDEHPNVASLRRRVAQQERVVARERGSGGTGGNALLTGLDREIALLKDHLADADAQMEDLRERVDRTPKVGEELTALTEREQILREDYLDTLRKVEEAELAENLEMSQQGAQLSVLDEAHPPAEPKRSRLMVFAVGVVGTLGLVAALALALEWFDPVVVSAADLERLTGVAPLGSMPRVSAS